MNFRPFDDAQLPELMSWFVDAAACQTWGGPEFRFPFMESTFREDCRIGRVPSWWLADFVVAYTFPMMNEHLSTAATLACYAVFCALALVYVRARVPETKGRRLEELEALFVKGGSA